MTDTRKTSKRPKSKVGIAERFRLNSFFAGIGGFDFGFQQAGCDPVFHCEISTYCRSVLERHWPGVPVAEDVNKVDASQLPAADIWCGGFPCQDVSVARGSKGRAGLKGKNTGLFYPFMKLVGEARPNVLLLENVTGLLNSHKGRDFLTVVKTLTEMGYGVAWRVFNTRYFGAPQSRPRVYICAWLGDVSSAVASLYQAEGMHKPEDKRAGFLAPHRCETTGAVVPEVSYCLAATSGRHTGTDWSRSYVSYANRVRRLTPAECEGLQGFPLGWSVPSKNFRLQVEDIDTLRYHALGNAVSTPVVKWVAGRIVSRLLSEAAKAPALSRDLLGDAAGDLLKETYREFVLNSLRSQQLSVLANEAEKADYEVKWKSGGFATGDIICDASSSPAPFAPIPSRFIDVVEKREVADHYFLSPNAAEGILRRVSGQNRVLFGPLQEALVRLAAKASPRKDSPAAKHPSRHSDSANPNQAAA